MIKYGVNSFINMIKKQLSTYSHEHNSIDLLLVPKNKLGVHHCQQ